MVLRRRHGADHIGATAATTAADTTAATRFVQHRVDETDNLVGVAVRYHTSVAMLRRHNRGLSMMSSSIPPHIKTLKIPVCCDGSSPGPAADEATRQAQLKALRIKEFRALLDADVTDQEVMYYLSCNELDVHKSVEAFRTDSLWEQSVALAKRVGLNPRSKSAIHLAEAYLQQAHGSTDDAAENFIQDHTRQPEKTRSAPLTELTEITPLVSPDANRRNPSLLRFSSF